ncbi:GNAT family N-acetyltransferase [Candidatus Methylomirabilis sp.]|uniref:GNAT family N-acetyltransferase n=1 Tax=Candidatus Methylomirabilis sp. TaxID=2032687 RepID=UPI0030767D36
MPAHKETARIDAGIVHIDPAGRWVIRRYRPEDTGRILALFRTVFGVECLPEHWRWKYEANPLGHYSLVVETPSGELVGHYGGVPVRIAWGEKTVVMPQIADAMIDPQVRRGLRRPGVFAPLVNQYIAGLGQMAGGYGFPTPEHLRAGKRLAGFVPLGPVPLLTKPIHVGATAQGRRSLFVTVNEEKELDAGLDRLWERCRHDLSVAVIRDAAYLRWRYLQCPDAHYHLLVARRRFSGTVMGVAVVRLGWQDRPVACLVDWLVPSGSAAVGEALLAYVEWLAGTAGMESLQAWFPPPSGQLRFLLAAGFRHEPTPYELVALSADPSILLEGAGDRWYYTMGDSDIY